MTRRALTRPFGRLSFDAWLSVLCVVTAIFVLGYPLFGCRYPPMTDLPFHAAMTGTLRHFGDPTFHFQEQFDWTPLAVPYLSYYALGALFMVFFSAVTATKLATFVFLALLPGGLALYCHGLKKSPLLGALGLLVVWGPLTHWGFINYVGAIGLFVSALGLALLIADRPTYLRQLGLLVVLVLLFFTHIYRLPFALIGVVGVALVMFPVSRRIVPVLWPVLPALGLLALWYQIRPEALARPMEPLTFHSERWHELSVISRSFFDPGEVRAWNWGVGLALAFGALGLLTRLRGRAGHEKPAGSRGFRVAALLVSLGAVAGSLLLFFVLPLQIGDWWYVYPREATSAALCALALLPTLPSSKLARAGLLGIALLASIPITLTVAENYRAFDAETADFERIQAKIPKAPRLLYLVFDHQVSPRTVSPFTHLPAWIQAEQGGWLSYHFEKYGGTPMHYKPREGREDVIPPPTPNWWEYTPQRFDVLTRGAFFDWFLVRKLDDPAAFFAADPDIALVAHEGKWWLYARKQE